MPSSLFGESFLQAGIFVFVFISQCDYTRTTDIGITEDVLQEDRLNGFLFSSQEHLHKLAVLEKDTVAELKNYLADKKQPLNTIKM